jgi:hypothetical protein
LDVLTHHAELVLVIGGSLLDSPLTFAIAGDVDGVLLRVEQGSSSTVLSACAERLELAGAHVIGYVDDVGSKARSRRPLGRRGGYRASGREHADDAVVTFPEPPREVADRVIPTLPRSKAQP